MSQILDIGFFGTEDFTVLLGISIEKAVVKIIYEDIEKWITKITKPQTSNFPIRPYASKAKYWIYPYEDRASLQLKACFFDSNFDIYICLPTNQFMSVEEANIIAENCNRIAKDTITLVDHPKDPGFIGDTYTGNGKYVVFLIQKKKDLIKARRNLKTKGY